MRASEGTAGHLSSHRAMKVGLVIQTAVALFLLLSPAQVGSEAARSVALCTEKIPPIPVFIYFYTCKNSIS